MNLALKVIPPVQLVICSSMMFALAHFLPQYYFSFLFQMPVIILLIVTSAIIATLALHDFRKHKTTYHPHTPEKTSKVVNSGIYAYSRNPMYLALVLTLLALAIYLKNLTCFTVIPLFIWYITRFQIKPEEEVLDRLFPNDYQNYCKNVRRWF